jgi:DNA-binding HxlR family transcriptional regulator
VTEQVEREIFDRIANKWALLIVNALGGGTLRFTELRTAVQGISHKMLTQTLRGLERDGLLDRYVHPTVPPRVDYTLTDLGHELRARITGLCAWTRGNTTRIQAARLRFDQANHQMPGQRRRADATAVAPNTSSAAR